MLSFPFQRDFAPREQSDTREQCDTGEAQRGQKRPLPMGQMPQAAWRAPGTEPAATGGFIGTMCLQMRHFRSFWAG